MLKLNIRLEQSADYRAVEELTRNAFWESSNHFCDEHLLVHKLRNIPEYIAGLDYIAELDGKLVGSVFYSKAKIVADDGHEFVGIITFGPLSVLPEYQFQGIGRALMEFSIAEAKRLGYRGIVFFGHPDYYPRLGFRRAYEFGILPQWGADDCEPLMAMPLYGGAFDGVSGKFVESDAFSDLPKSELMEFDRLFPPKASPKRQPIEMLLERLEPPARKALGAFLDPPFNWKLLADMRGISERQMLGVPGIDANAIAVIKQVMRENGKRWGV
jgi:predicted N-acetyltransferase YhbS